MSPTWCTAVQGDCLLHVVVVPRAARSRLIGQHDGRLKVHLAAPPTDGEANQELLRMIAELLNISRSRVELVSGFGGKRKTICLRGMALEHLRVRFGVYV